MTAVAYPGIISIGSICDSASKSPTHRNKIEGDRIVRAGPIIIFSLNGENIFAFCLKESKLKIPPHQITSKFENEIDASVAYSCNARLGEAFKHIIATHVQTKNFNYPIVY